MQTAAPIGLAKAHGERGPVQVQSAATPARARPARTRDTGGTEAETRRRATTNTLEDLARRKGVEEAWQALEQMLRQGLPVDKCTVSRMLTRSLGDGAKMDARRAHAAVARVEAFMDARPEEVDDVLFNAVLDACCRLRDLKKVEALMRRVEPLSIKPSSVTLGILVKAYGQAGDLRKVVSIWKQIESQQIECNEVTYGCMIDACVKCADVEKAREIFEGLRRERKHKNTIFYTQLIKGYGQQREFARAMELFQEMPKEDVPYNRITWNSMVDACVRCGEVGVAEQLLARMVARGGSERPDLVTFSIVLKGHCQRGDLDKALGAAESIRKQGMDWDELVYNTLMDGCVKARDVETGVGLWKEMTSIGLRPSTITHNILARLFRSGGYREEEAAQEIARLYQMFGCQPPESGSGAKAGRC